MISRILSGFKRRLLSVAHWLILLSSVWHEAEVSSGTIVSQRMAYFSKLPSVIGRRSPALTTYEAGPRSSACIFASDAELKTTSYRDGGRLFRNFPFSVLEQFNN